MTDIFIKVIEMSMTASIVIGVVMVLRLFLRKAPKVFSYVLWAAALFRLLCPTSFELPSAPIPSIEIPYSTDVNDRNADGLFITNNDVEIAPAPEYSEPQIEESPQVTTVSEPVSETPVKREINYIAIASYIWALAVIIMTFRGVASWVRLSHSLRSAQKMSGNVYVSPAISDPFIMGIVRPKIYLPTGLSCTESDLIIRHEKAHMHRGDHIAKLVMYGALCVHCFNPLVWLMFRLFERDMEMSCDEKVTANMTKEQKADYSQTLLKISAKPTAAFTACFGESGTKQRIKNVLSFKKPAVWVVIVLAVAAVIVSVFLCADKEKSDDTVTIPDVYMMDYREATELLNNAGLHTAVVFSFSEENENTVIETIPERGEKAEKDSTVIVYVSEIPEAEKNIMQDYLVNSDSDILQDDKNPWTEQDIIDMFNRMENSDKLKYIDCVLIPDSDYEPIGAVLFEAVTKGRVEISFFYEDGSAQQCDYTFHAKAADDPELTYHGKGTVSFKLETEEHTIETYTLTISADGRNVEFIGTAEGNEAPEPVTVPDVSKLNYRKAAELIKNAGLRPAFVFRFSEEEQNTVIKTIPDKGEVTGMDSYVTVQVSVGPETEENKTE